MTDMTCSGEAHQWFHGSQQRITVLRAGSSITQEIAIARIFSHRPSLVSQFGDGRIKHDGSTPGYLYIVDEPITQDDMYPHPHPINSSKWEWLTRRELRLRLIAQTRVYAHEHLTTYEQQELRLKQTAAGRASFRE